MKIRIHNDVAIARSISMIFQLIKFYNVFNEFHFGNSLRFFFLILLGTMDIQNKQLLTFMYKFNSKFSSS